MVTAEQACFSIKKKKKKSGRIAYRYQRIMMTKAETDTSKNLQAC